jgi:hypothetical protein
MWCAALSPHFTMFSFIVIRSVVLNYRHVANVKIIPTHHFRLKIMRNIIFATLRQEQIRIISNWFFGCAFSTVINFILLITSVLFHSGCPGKCSKRGEGLMAKKISQKSADDVRTVKIFTAIQFQKQTDRVLAVA